MVLGTDGASASCHRRQRQSRNLFPYIFHLCVYLVGTDAGPDMLGTGTWITKQLADDILTWVIWTYCFQHQLQLMVKRQLRRVGPFFGNMAKMSN